MICNHKHEKIIFVMDVPLYLNLKTLYDEKKYCSFFTLSFSNL